MLSTYAHESTDGRYQVFARVTDKAEVCTLGKGKPSIYRGHFPDVTIVEYCSVLSACCSVRDILV
ncbi:MAG: hypothetical protein HUJ51_04205 [Eggerthellaceae bacterium]|nr:hypothetical protein [Eggerthellaceae bacterium]